MFDGPTCFREHWDGLLSGSSGQTVTGFDLRDRVARLNYVGQPISICFEWANAHTYTLARSGHTIPPDYALLGLQENRPPTSPLCTNQIRPVDPL